MPRRKAVDAWFAKYDNPMKPVVQAIREVILAADPRMDECIKWQAPTFTYEGNLASFFPKAKQHASLMFHQGAKIPGTFSRLEGSGVGRVMKLGTLADVKAAKPELVAIVKAWIAMKAAAAKPAAKQAATTSRAAAKPRRPSRSAARR